MSDGGFISPLIYLDSGVRNVRRAGYDPGLGQYVAWITWDYHPNPSTYSVNWARIHNDGTFERDLDVATGAAGAAGARGSTRTTPPRGYPRILIAYVTGDLIPFDGRIGHLPCGRKLEALIYNEYGALVAGPITVDTVADPYCLSGPVEKALVNTSNFSYQSFHHDNEGESRNPKFWDTISTPQDADPIGLRLCTDGHPRGWCYYNEAMANIGYYTAVLYADESEGPTLHPLFLSMLDAS